MDLIAQLPLIGPTLATVIPFLLVLAIVVFVHEYGHYIVGRWCGIGAEVFSIGFGREIYGWTDSRGTRWRVAMIPLGGYVKFTGDADVSSSHADATSLSRLDAKGRAQSFHLASVGRRALTVAAGPAFNFILSILIFGAMALAQGRPDDAPVIGALAEDANPEFSALVQPGDRILAVNGEPVEDFLALQTRLLDSEGAPLDLRLDRGGEERTVGVSYRPPARVDGVTPGGAADRAGLQAGDVIVAVDGAPVGGFSDLQRVTRDGAGAAMTLSVLRDGATFEATVTPDLVETTDALTGEAVTRPLLGVQKQQTEVTPRLEGVGPIGAATAGVERTWAVIALSLSGLWEVVAGDQPAGEVLGGPIRIAEVSGDAAASGFGTFIGLVAVLSASIGLINLFPIPILDGGHLMFYALEKIRGRPLGERWLEIGNSIGLALVLSLMLFATFNDIARL